MALGTRIKRWRQGSDFSSKSAGVQADRARSDVDEKWDALIETILFHPYSDRGLHDALAQSLLSPRSSRKF
jgi:hypothetical protein